jgi:hypothetical protein
MKPQFTVTYDIVTYESAEHGDAAERGFVLPGQWHVELPDRVCGEAAGAIMDDCKMTLREAIDLVGCCETDACGRSYYETDGHVDYRTGAEERRALHLPRNATASTRRRIARLLEWNR